METIQERLDKELSEGNSIASWAIGYYIESGNEHSPSFKIPIFDIPDYLRSCTHYPPPSRRVKVLIDYLGSMMWINTVVGRIYFGYGGKDSPSLEGKELRRKLESLKSMN
jgi:hypothetical protein